MEIQAARKAIYDFLMEAALSGRVGIGERLPTENELAAKFATTRANARFCVELLKSHGIAVSNKKDGTRFLRAPNAFIKRAMDGMFSDNVFVLSALRGMPSYHWNEVSFAALRREVEGAGYRLHVEEYARAMTRAELAAALDAIYGRGCRALAMLGGNSILPLFSNSADLIYQHAGSNAYLFVPGLALAEDLPFNVVALDHCREGVLAGEHILRQGIRRVIYIESAGSVESWWAGARKNGLSYACRRETADEVYLEIRRKPRETDFSEIVRELKTVPGYPAVVFPTIDTAIVFYEAAAAAGYSAPENFLLVSFGKPQTEIAYPIVTVEPPFAAIGAAIGRLITGKIPQEWGHSRITIKMEPVLVDRRQKHSAE